MQSHDEGEPCPACGQPVQWCGTPQGLLALDRLYPTWRLSEPTPDGPTAVPAPGVYVQHTALCWQGILRDVPPPQYARGARVRVNKYIVTQATDGPYRVVEYALCWLEDCATPVWVYTVRHWQPQAYQQAGWLFHGLRESEIQTWEDQP